LYPSLEVNVLFFIEETNHGGEYILIKHEGNFTIEEFEESAHSTKALLAEHRRNRLLVDLRGVTNRIPLANVYYIIEFDKKIFPSAKIAVLFPLEREEDARFAETVAENRGVNLKAFTSHEKALHWLTSRHAC